MEESLSPVRPCEPVAAYIGGKRNLAGRIVDILAAVPHHIYAEPFVGMGGVFLRRRHRARAEVINDISTDVATLFRVLQRHYVALMDMLRWQLTSREAFDRLVASHADSLTDLERAARFLYLQRTSFGGKVSGRHFGVSPASPARFDVGKLETILLSVHERLSGVVIERLPWRAFIPRYDRPETLFYLDPPYYGSEADYGADIFRRTDFEQLAEALGAIKGRFLLSLNDHPEVRRIFAHFDVEAVQTTYTLGGANRGGGKAAELLISHGLVRAP